MDIAQVIRLAGIDPAMGRIQRMSDKPPLPTYAFSLPKEQIVERWRLFRQYAPQTGYWPLIHWSWKTDMEYQEEEPSSILEAAFKIDMAQWFLDNGSVISDSRMFGPGNIAFPAFQLQIPFQQFSGHPTDSAPLLLLPCDEPWQIPAYIQLTTDDAQPAAIHTAILKYWSERWGCILCASAGNMMELMVERPPTNEQAALALAKEQYIYCPDLVDQNTVTITRLAQLLLNSHVWWFWWD